MVSRFAPNGVGEGSDSLISWLDLRVYSQQAMSGLSGGMQKLFKRTGSKGQVVVQLRGVHLMIGATLKSKRRTGCRKNTN